MAETKQIDEIPESEKGADTQPFDASPKGDGNGDSEGNGEQKLSRKERRALAKEEKVKAKAEKAAEAEEAEKKTSEAPLRDFHRIGHKGADSIVTGNTIASFEAAVEAGAEIIEFDVLRTPEGRLVIAHDYADAAKRRPLDLHEALRAFNEPPLENVEIDCDLKLAGREAELAGAIAGHGLTERAMVSTMEESSIVKLRQHEPELRLGWTFPKTRRDWTKERWAKPVLGAGMAVMRRRLPGLIPEKVDELEIDAVWAYHWLVTAEAVAAADSAEVELYAWTVDDPERVDELAAMGVHGIVSNDPRILT